MEILTGILRFVEFGLKNLDPSLFQNIILGILAIFIPFAIVFLTDILHSEKQRSEFEKMVLSEEVLETKKVFGYSIIGIGVLAFFTGKDISTIEKILALIFSIAILWLLSRPLWKILKFSDGQQFKFEISFLKKLNFSKFLTYKNDSKAKKMIRAWGLFWAGETILGYRETIEIIEIFNGHIEGAIVNKKYDKSVPLARVYKENFNKIEVYMMGNDILPKSLDWCEKCWEAKQTYKKRREKYRKTPRKILSKFRSNGRKENDLSWVSVYFRDKFLAAVISKMLSDREGHNVLFAFFGKYIKKKEAEKKFEYTENLLRTFCREFFENSHGALGKGTPWRYDFPKRWRITAKNSKKRIPRFIFYYFWVWAQSRISPENSTERDNVLSEVLSGIFPNVHSRLFSSFLILFCSEDLTHAIQQNVVFNISDAYRFSPFKDEKEATEMFDQRERSQRKETMNVILKYFGNFSPAQGWEPITVYENDISSEDVQHWGQYSDKRKKIIFAKIKEKKLRKLLNELNSKEIDDLCKNSKGYQIQRNKFIELTELLIEKVSKESTTTPQNAHPSIS